MYLRHMVARKSAIPCSTFLNVKPSSWPPNLTFQCQPAKINNNNIAPTCTRYFCQDEKNSEPIEPSQKIQDAQETKRPADDLQNLDNGVKSTQNVPDFESTDEDKRNLESTDSSSNIQDGQKSARPAEDVENSATSDLNEDKQHVSETESENKNRTNPSSSDDNSKIQSVEDLEHPEGTCCMTGCANCVWLDYAEKLTEYYKDGGDKALQEIEEKIKDPSLKAFLLHEIKMRQS